MILQSRLGYAIDNFFLDFRVFVDEGVVSETCKRTPFNELLIGSATDPESVDLDFRCLGTVLLNQLNYFIRVLHCAVCQQVNLRSVITILHSILDLLKDINQRLVNLSPVKVGLKSFNLSNGNFSIFFRVIN